MELERKVERKKRKEKGRKKRRKYERTNKLTNERKILFGDSRTAGVPAVLKFLKFQSCPEIVLNFEIVLKF